MDETGGLKWWRIIEVDYASAFAVMGPVVFWVFYALLVVFGGLPNPFAGEGIGGVFIVGLAITAVALVALPLRIARIRGMFVHGLAVPGKVEGVGFYRDRGRVEFSYHYMGEDYRAGSGVMKGKRTEALLKGQAVTVLVDRERPERAVIRDLYV